MTSTVKRYVIALSQAGVVAFVAVALWNANVRNYVRFVVGRVAGESTVEKRLSEFEDEVTGRLKPVFERSGVTWPCRDIVLVGLKEERQLRVYARTSNDSSWTLVITFPILGASGTVGPKLNEGDEQVPEGIYVVAESEQSIPCVDAVELPQRV